MVLQKGLHGEVLVRRVLRRRAASASKAAGFARWLGLSIRSKAAIQDLAQDDHVAVGVAGAVIRVKKLRETGSQFLARERRLGRREAGASGKQSDGQNARRTRRRADPAAGRHLGEELGHGGGVEGAADHHVPAVPDSRHD